MSVAFPSADFIPTLSGYTGQGPFRFWCQKVLPLVYDDSLSYYELLNKVVVYLNNVIKDMGTVAENIDSMLLAYKVLLEFIENYTLEVKPEEIEKILQAHPEWVTTVQDYSLEEDKLTKNTLMALSNDLSSMELVGVYQGELVFPYRYVPSSFCFDLYDDNILYIFCFDRESNVGKIVEIDLEANAVISERDKTLFHANAACAVPNRDCYYIAATIGQKGLLKYTPGFNSYEIVCDDVSFSGVSYDEVTDTLYGYSSGSGTVRIIDEQDHHTIYRTLDIETANFNQSFCVHNNICYISGFKREYCVVDLSTESPIIRYGVIDRNDGFGKFIFDENEGWDFHKGALYGIEYSKHRQVNSFGFFVKYSKPEYLTARGSTVLAGSQFTANITDGNITKFNLAEIQFKHPNQLNTSQQFFNTLQITTQENFGNVYLSNISVINRNLVCDTLELRGSSLFFDCADSSCVVNINRINTASRGALIVFGGSEEANITIGSTTPGLSRTMYLVGAGIKINSSDPIFDSTPYNDVKLFCGTRLINTPELFEILNDSISVGANSSVIAVRYLPITLSAGGRLFVEVGNPGVICSCARTTGTNYTKLNLTFYNTTNNPVTISNIRLILFRFNSKTSYPASDVINPPT